MVINFGENRATINVIEFQYVILLKNLRLYKKE